MTSHQKPILPEASQVESIYLGKFTGYDSRRLSLLLRNSFRKQSFYNIITNPNQVRNNKNLAILQTELKEISFWETQSTTGQTLANLPRAEVGRAELGTGAGPSAAGNPAPLPSATNQVQQELAPEEEIPLVTSNLVLRFRFKLLRFSDNTVLFDEEVEQSFQQYYRGEAEIESRPDAQFETDRLSRLIFDRVAFRLNFDETEEVLELEQGVNTEWHRGILGLRGDETIVKGIRFAEGKNWRDALLAWLVVTYEPLGYNDREDFITNRASAFYNMGQTYRLLGNWKQAALMYSRANQTKKKLHYAQAWADAIQIWKDTQYTTATNELIFYKEQNDAPVSSRTIDNNTLLRKETLWPFEKFFDDQESPEEKEALGR